MTKKILFVHPSNELYGSDRSLLRLVSSLDKNAYKPYVFVPNDLPYEGLLTKELSKVNIEYYEINLGILRRMYRNPKGMAIFGFNTLLSAFRIARFCRQNKINLIHTNSTAVFSGALAARLANIPHVWHVREIIVKPQWLNKSVAWMLDKLSTTIIAVSTPVMENLLSVQPQLEGKIQIIHNGMSADPFFNVSQQEVDQIRQAWDIQKNDIVIGMVGRISAWKGQEFLLNGASTILKTTPNSHLVMVGGVVPGENWRREALVKQSRSLGVANRVHIEDFRLDIPAVLSAFDIFVLPSIRPDPFPGVVLEAMFSAKPVVATAHGGAIEQVEIDMTGMLISAKNPKGIDRLFTTSCK